MAHLLIIDDEKMICEEFCAALTDIGHQAEFALNGPQAFQKIEKNDYDLIFLDLSMPNINGAEVFKRIRQIKNTPVAFMAGFISPETEKEVLQLGALCCLRKPVHLSEISDLIDGLDHLSPQAQ